MTTRHKALLIGASDYDEPGIRSLPFVRDDLARLSAALTERGFHSAEVAESNATMRHRVSFREAAQVATRLGMTHEAEDWFG